MINNLILDQEVDLLDLTASECGGWTTGLTGCLEVASPYINSGYAFLPEAEFLVLKRYTDKGLESFNMYDEEV